MPEQTRMQARGRQTPPKKRSTQKPGMQRSRYTRAQISEIFARLQAANPTPQTELHYTNDYTLLIAVMLSAQATDRGVNKATGALFEIADTPQKMIDLGEERLRHAIRSIGLYRTKARNVIAASRQLIERFEGKVPRSLGALESLPGVGRKTANVILNTAFGVPTIAVDTHVFRLANRIGLAPASTPLGVERALMRVIPAPWLGNAHHWLILHGRYICTARAPKCASCPICDLCVSRENTMRAGADRHSARAGLAKGAGEGSQ